MLVASEKCSMTIHADAIAKDGEFILCTNSGQCGVDCGIFAVQKNVPTLAFSTYVKNENIKNFTQAITDVITCVKNTYGITIKQACFAGPGVPSVQRDYLQHMRLPYVIDAKEIIAKNDLTCAIIVNDFLAMSYGIDFVDNAQRTTLYDAPAEKNGNRVIIGAGSGLGLLQ